ncbi:MAG: ATP-dependent helicase [Planctomycetota bacterium]
MCARKSGRKRRRKAGAKPGKSKAKTARPTPAKRKSGPAKPPKRGRARAKGKKRAKRPASPAAPRARGGRSKTPDLASLFEPYVWSWFERTFDGPSPPQLAAWPKIAGGRNTLIFSPTGSGKTLAAFMWTLNDLFRAGANGELDDSTYVLYVSPLKALNNDIQRNLVEPLGGIHEAAHAAGVDVPEVRSMVRTGDTTQKDRAAMARRPPHILITTPESLFIILSTEKARLALKTVRYVIVDEIHAISGNKRGVHLSLSLERLAHLAGRDFTRVGLSATQRPLDEIARFLVGAGEDGEPRPCEIVDTGSRKNLNVGVISPVDNLLEAHFDAIWGSAYDRMLSLIREHGTTLVFTNSRYKTERTALRLTELSSAAPLAVGAHHGSMSKEVRLDAEARLKRGDLDAVVATSSLELGIDVGSIDLVCQVESPKSVSSGMQRIGRAGHLLDATSEGRLIVTDRDDLVECAVLVKAITDGEVDRTRVPTLCLDVLAQHVVGAVAADDWGAEELYALLRRSHCYRDLEREAFDRVLDLVGGNYRFDTEFPPYPKITWDKVNDRLSPERAARLIAFRSSGTIPDVADYDVWFEKKRTRVGRLDEGFVEELRAGDIFILGSSSWKVLGVRRNRVIVDDVYGRPPTIPFWHGDRSSRTYDLGVLVGRFRRELGSRLDSSGVGAWLRRKYHVDANGARAILDYFREQRAVTGEIPSDGLVLVERFRDELGRVRLVVHSPFGVRVNDPWAMALARAVEETHGFRPQTATVDDGILVTIPKDRELDVGRGGEGLLGFVTSSAVDGLLERAVRESPVFASRFRHNAVRSLVVLREYRGRRTPVWLQSLRASALLEACREDGDCPLVAETMRECMNESLDVPGLRQVLAGLESGAIASRAIETEVPSPFTHSLLLLGQYGDAGAVPARERRARLMHLHRELLKQILDEETLANLLDAEVVEEVDARLQARHPTRRALDANELARVLIDLGDLVACPDDEISIIDRVGPGAEREATELLEELVRARRAVLVPIPTAETNRERWIATESFALYRAAFAAEVKPSSAHRKLLARIAKRRRVSASAEKRLEKLVAGYRALRFPGPEGAEYIAAGAVVPKGMLSPKLSREEARLELVRKFMRSRGPVTKYEVMERWGFSEPWVERALERLRGEGLLARGEYVPTKALPQWCAKPNLEEIHRLTLARLRREMEPATPKEYADFLLRRQHVHPGSRLSGLEGLRACLAQLQGQENYQAVWERDVLPARVDDYAPHMLDRLCYGGEVVWRRFDHEVLKRGQIGFCLREEQPRVVANPEAVAMKPDQWDDDIPEQCGAVRRFLADRGASFFDDIVEGTGLDWRYALRAAWHLVWTGEATNDSYESIRHANFITGLSGCYDLGSRPRKAGVTIDSIVRHMLENRKLDPKLGRWSPTERILGDTRVSREERAARWADLMLDRWGVVCRDALKREVGAPPWGDVRRALARMELLGKVRRGFFVQDLSGEQYARPEAVDALRDAKLRRCGGSGSADGSSRESEKDGGAREAADTGEPLLLVSMCDPANPFGGLFPVTDASGEKVKYGRGAGNYVLLRAGRPLLLWHGSVRLLVDMSREEAERAMRKVMELGEVSVARWNGHPIDVSPARHLLTTLGFIQGRTRWERKWRGMVFDGARLPDDDALSHAEKECPDTFEREGKERAPVRYDAEWVASRSHETIRPKVRELVKTLRDMLPRACKFEFGPHGLVVRYRGVRCVSPHIQQKQIWVHVTHKGWVPGVRVTPETDLGGEEFRQQVLGRFGATKREIDRLVDARSRRAEAT